MSCHLTRPSTAQMEAIADAVVLLAAQSCQAVMERGTASRPTELCGEGPAYCRNCDDCRQPVCDSHSLRLKKYGIFCFPCGLLVQRAIGRRDMVAERRKVVAK